LLNIGEWLLKTYPKMDDLEGDPETWDLMVCFVGETYRRRLKGEWVLECKDKKSMYYGLPVVIFGEGIVFEEMQYFYDLTYIFTMMIHRNETDNLKVYYLEFIEDMEKDGAL